MGGGGGGSEKPKFLKKSMKLNWNFQRGGVWVQTQKSSTGGVLIFYVTHWCFFLYKCLIGC